MANNIKGINIDIGGNTEPLKKALAGVNKTSIDLQNELKEVNKQLKFEPKNTVLLQQKQDLLAKSITNTKDKLGSLKEAEKQVEQQFKQGKIGEEQFRALQREVILTESQLGNLERQYIRIGTVASRSITDVGNSVKKVGDSVTNVGKQVSVASVAVAGLGVGSVASYKTVKEGMDEVIKATGATGQSAKDLEITYKNISKNSTSDFMAVGKALGEVNTRFNLTGKVAEDCTLQFLKFAELNNIEVKTSVALVSRAMGDAGIEAKNYGSVLDMLTVASQKSGITIENLTTNLAKYGAPMRALGVDTETSIAMFAGWEKAGVNTELAFGGMKKAISNWGSQGKDSSKEFAKTLEQIKKAPDIAKATTMAIDIFGQKAGPDLADAIQGGRFEVQEYIEALKKAGGTVEATYNEMDDGTKAITKAQHEAQIAVSEFGNTIIQTLMPIINSLIEKIKGASEYLNGLDESTRRKIVMVGLMIAVLGPLLIIIGALISAIGSIIAGAGGVVLAYTTISGAIAILTGTAVVATPAMTALAGVITFMTGPIGIAIGVIAGLAIAVGGVALHHKRQADEVKKTEEAYKKFNETLSGGSVKDLKEYEEELKFHQQTLVDLRTKMEEYNKTGNSIDYNNAKIQLEDYITTIEKQGYHVDKVTGKVVELAQVSNRINTREQLDKVTEMIEKRVDENSKIISLIDRYTQLNNTKERTQAEDIELSNTAKELNSKYSDLKLSIDKNGNAIINNIKLLGNKKNALEVDIQMIKANAYEQAKSAIYSEQIEIGKTKATITQIEERIKARDAEIQAMEAQAERAGGAVSKRFLSSQEKEENKTYVDAYYRLQKIKEQISVINIPQAQSHSQSNDISEYEDIFKDKDKKSTNETFETGIEATSKYSKVLVELGQDLKKVDNNIESIQNKIETSKAIGTAEELAKATKEQNNLYQAQAEKVSFLQNSEKVLSDNKKRLIQEFKSSFGDLKNTDLNNWEESDFQNFIEKTYKQTTITDKARAEALKKGQKYTQDLAKDLATLNSKIESVGDNLVNAKKSQLQTLKELHEQEESENKKLVDSINKLNVSIKNSLKERYKEQEDAENDSINAKIEANNNWKEDTLNSINTVHNAKIKALDDEARRYDIANKDQDDATKEAELSKILTLNYSKKKKEEAQAELDKLLKDKEQRKYKESLDAQKESLNTQFEVDKTNVETIAKNNNEFYKTQLDDVKTFYANKVKFANIDAEAQKLIVGNNQKEIISLLKTYDEDYANVGMTLGESLASSFRDKLYGIVDTLNGVFNSMNQSVNMFQLGTVTPSMTGMGVGSYSSNSNTTNNSTNYGALLHTDTVTINNEMDIQTLAEELSFYMSQKNRGKGGE